MWKRYRFITRSVNDYRPIVFNPQYPWWHMGYGTDEKGQYVIIVCYLPLDEDLYKYWDDAESIDVEHRDDIIFSDRYPMPPFYIAMRRFIDQSTTINFEGIKNKDILDKYNENSNFTILKTCKNGYVLMDDNYDQIELPKKNINFFKK